MSTFQKRIRQRIPAANPEYPDPASQLGGVVGDGGARSGKSGGMGSRQKTDVRDNEAEVYLKLQLWISYLPGFIGANIDFLWDIFIDHIPLNVVTMAIEVSHQRCGVID